MMNRLGIRQQTTQDSYNGDAKQIVKAMPHAGLSERRDQQGTRPYVSSFTPVQSKRVATPFCKKPTLLIFEDPDGDSSRGREEKVEVNEKERKQQFGEGGDAAQAHHQEDLSEEIGEDEETGDSSMQTTASEENSFNGYDGLRGWSLPKINTIDNFDEVWNSLHVSAHESDTEIDTVGGGVDQADSSFEREINDFLYGRQLPLLRDDDEKEKSSRFEMAQ